MTTTHAVYRASDKQVAFVRKLAAERLVPVAGRDDDEAMLIARYEDLHEVGEDRRFVSSREASAVIDWLMTLPRVERPERRLAEEGYYSRDGEFYVVVKAKNSDHRYAKKLEISESFDMQHGARKTVRWVYTPGLVGNLREEDRLTLDEAREFGHLHGMCMFGHPLTDPKSVELGVGPVCRKRLGI